MRLGLCNSLLLAFLTMACANSIAAENETARSTFDRKVAPILAAHCLECHSGSEPNGELDLSRRTSAFQGGESGSAIVAGDPGDSLVWQMIETEDMPPKHPMPEAQKEVIREWIKSGASGVAIRLIRLNLPLTAEQAMTGGHFSHCPSQRFLCSIMMGGLATTSIDSFLRSFTQTASRLHRGPTHGH